MPNPFFSAFLPSLTEGLAKIPAAGYAGTIAGQDLALDRDLKRAQIDLAKAHAGYYQHRPLTGIKTDPKWESLMKFMGLPKAMQQEILSNPAMAAIYLPQIAQHEERLRFEKEMNELKEQRHKADEASRQRMHDINLAFQVAKGNLTIEQAINLGANKQELAEALATIQVGKAQDLSTIATKGAQDRSDIQTKGLRERSDIRTETAKSLSAERLAAARAMNAERLKQAEAMGDEAAIQKARLNQIALDKAQRDMDIALKRAQGLSDIAIVRGQRLADISTQKAERLAEIQKGVAELKAKLGPGGRAMTPNQRLQERTLRALEAVEAEEAGGDKASPQDHQLVKLFFEGKGGGAKDKFTVTDKQTPLGPEHTTTRTFASQEEYQKYLGSLQAVDQEIANRGLNQSPSPITSMWGSGLSKEDWMKAATDLLAQDFTNEQRAHAMDRLNKAWPGHPPFAAPAEIPLKPPSPAPKAPADKPTASADKPTRWDGKIAVTLSRWNLDVPPGSPQSRLTEAEWQRVAKQLLEGTKNPELRALFERALNRVHKVS